MKNIIFLLLSVNLAFSLDNQVLMNSIDKVSLLKSDVVNKGTLSKKERAYLEEEKLKELENQKLEDDGFCSCNNN